MGKLGKALLGVGILISSFLTIQAALSGTELTGDVEELESYQDRPEELTLVDWGYTYLAVTWKPPFFWTGEGIGYMLSVLEEGNSFRYKLRINGVNNRKFNATGLKPSTEYTFLLTAISRKHGVQIASKGVMLVRRTSSPEDPTPPRNFRLVSVSPVNVTLAWDKPENWNGSPGGYTITDPSGDLDVNTVRLEGEDNTRFTATGLKLKTRYGFDLQSYNLNSGNNTHSQIVHLDVDTPKRPDEPVNVNVTYVESSFVVLTWKKPENQVISGYIVYHVTEEAVYKDFLSGDNSNHYNVSDLKPWSYYEIHVASFVTQGIEHLESYNVTTTVRTMYSDPSQPVTPVAFNVTDTTVSLKWGPSERPNGPLSGYNISWLADGKTTSRTTKKTSIVLDNLTPWMIYNFSVTAYNVQPFGPTRSSRPMSVQKRTNPAAPTDGPQPLKVTNVTSTSITVEWARPKTPNGPIDGYDLLCVSADGTVVENTTTPNATYKFTDLHPWQKYNIFVSAFNSYAGKDLPGPEAIIVSQTSPSEPGVPGSLTVETLTSRDLLVKWSEPRVTNGPIDGYYVSCRRTNGTLVSNNTTPKTEYLFNGLEPWTKYTFSVAAYNLLVKTQLIGLAANGSGQTQVDVPGAPVSLTAFDIVDTSLKVKWVKPQTPNGPIDGYTVFCHDPTGREFGNATTSDTKWTFKDLKPWTVYNISVSAYNALIGENSTELSGPEESVLQQTEIGDPSAPTEVKISGATNNSLQVTWKKPTNPNGPITGYFVRFGSQNSTQGNKTTETSLTLSNLKPWTNYTIAVRAFNEHNKVHRDGPEQAVQGQTTVAASSSPTNLASGSVTNTSFDVTWNRPDTPNGPISGYTVRNVNLKTSQDLPANAAKVSFSKLQPSTKYTIALSAYNLDSNKNRLTSPEKTIDVQTSACDGILTAKTAASIFVLLIIHTVKFLR